MIQYEIERLLKAKNDIAQSIIDKGVDVPSDIRIDEYSSLIDKIEQGGGGERWHCKNPLCIYTKQQYSRTITINRDRLLDCEISYDGENWTEAPASVIIRKADGSNDKFYLRAVLVTLGNTSSVVANKNTDVFITGDVSSLIEGTRGKLYPYCLQSAFNGVTSTIDELVLPNDDTVYNYSFQQMFYGCTNMTKTPSMASYKTIKAYGCSEMYSGCSYITTGPADFNPETLSGTYCCYRMFYGCTRMTTAMETLPITSTIGDRCAYQMFFNCSTLTKAPEIHGTPTTTTSIYGMFQNCAAITEVKLMDNISVANYANQIFYGCASLNDIYCHNTTSLSIASWFNTSTKQTGTLHKKAGVDLTGLPSGWTVVEDLE